MRHFNPTISTDVQRIFNLKGDSVSEVSEEIVPVVVVERFCNIVKRNSVTNGTSATIYTTPTDKDFYIVAANISTIKDATSTSLTERISVTIEGLLIAILEICSLTLTPQNDSMSISFPRPIKVDRGTNITVTNSTNVANITTVANIYGFTVETVKGS